MADHDILPYPMMFSQDQWLNKFSPYPNKAFPWPATYDPGASGPTDAHGRPIQSYQDTQKLHDTWAAANPPKTAAPVTLNTNPTRFSNVMDQAGYGDWSQLAPKISDDPQAQANYAYALGLGGKMDYSRPDQNGKFQAMLPGGGSAAAPQAAPHAAPQAAATNPYDMNTAYMHALQNPGYVPTPGATVPQSAPPSNQSGVLQQFLANWDKNGGQSQGAGNYNNSGFINALRGMV